MINDIIDGIASKLHQTFGDGYTLYKEKVPQGFKEPCFAIVHLLSSNEPKIPDRYLRLNAFDIHFFPKPGVDEKTEMYRVGECLLLALEYINCLDNLIRGTKMRYEIVDDVLHFFISYDLYVKVDRDDEHDYMTELTTNNTVEA